MISIFADSKTLSMTTDTFNVLFSNQQQKKVHIYHEIKAILSKSISVCKKRVKNVKINK